ncbi:MAG: NhaP-type Na+/H+ or K+/H+ antiporter [Planctomycetota bacterium]|jgi:NhaP-type Na+/H+ or K+/H+ antiporter
MLLLIENIKTEYIAIIAFSMVIILSFLFNIISKKTNIPSVLLLLLLGVIIQLFYPEIKTNPVISKILVIVGKIGLILIVLEAALDLKLEKDKIPLILKSFFTALFGLVGSSIAIAYVMQYFLGSSFYDSLVYAVPLSIMSSAIIIPSVSTCEEETKEFMIYESTLSDIFGIIFFQFLTSPDVFYSTKDVFLSVSSNIAITALFAIIFGYIAVWGIQKLTSHTKLFLIIAVLLLIYAIGSILHLSSLIIILFFGIILNNTDIFFAGFLKKTIDQEKIKHLFDDFYVITLESAFVMRTFFFVMFGITISLMSLINLSVALQSIVFIAILYVVRFIFLKMVYWKKSITTELFIAPRGLITVLLFYSIPAKYAIAEFDQGVILYTILITSLIMTVVLITSKGRKLTTIFKRYDTLNDRIEDSLEGGHDYPKIEFKDDDTLL